LPDLKIIVTPAGRLGCGTGIAYDLLGPCPAAGAWPGRGPGLAWAGSAEKMNIQVRDAKVSDVEMVQKIYSHHVLHGTGLILRQCFP
jgi:hypothetical protein